MQTSVTMNFSQCASEVLTPEYLFSAYYKRLYNFVFYRVNNHQTAEDLTSLIFEKIFKNKNKYDATKGIFEVWMFTIARNILNDYFRKKKRASFISLDKITFLRSDKKEPEEVVIASEEKNILSKALTKISKKDNEILALKFASELKNTEISEVLGISISNVGVMIHRALARLKKEMIKEGYIDE